MSLQVGQRISQPFAEHGVLAMGYVVTYEDRGTLILASMSNSQPEIHETARDAGIQAQALQQRWPGLKFNVGAIVPLATIGGVDA